MVNEIFEEIGEIIQSEPDKKSVLE